MAKSGVHIHKLKTCVPAERNNQRKLFYNGENFGITKVI